MILASALGCNPPVSSGVTSKPASRGHSKTGQLSASRTVMVLPYRWHFRQEFFKLSRFSAPDSGYTGLTWAEDRAANGLGIGEHVSVREFAETLDPLVTVSYPPKAVQGRIPVQYLMEADLHQVKVIPTDLAKMAQ